MPFIVVDVGNSRMKWAVADETSVRESAILPLTGPDAWETQAAAWREQAARWFITGSNPEVADAVRSWLAATGHAVSVISSYRQIPLKLAIEQPETVGLDRLFAVLAAKARITGQETAVVVSAGSAVTVDALGPDGAFHGGAIFPGLRLMALALHEHTARLPLVAVEQAHPSMPGTSTVPAMVAGIHGAVVGGVRYLVERLRTGSQVEPRCFLTGGDAQLLAPALGPGYVVWPEMTLEGIRLTALHLS